MFAISGDYLRQDITPARIGFNSSCVLVRANELMLERINCNMVFFIFEFESASMSWWSRKEDCVYKHFYRNAFVAVSKQTSSIFFNTSGIIIFPFNLVIMYAFTKSPAKCIAFSTTDWFLSKNKCFMLTVISPIKLELSYGAYPTLLYEFSSSIACFNDATLFSSDLNESEHSYSFLINTFGVISSFML